MTTVSSARPGFRFTLRQLLATITILALFLGLFVVVGLPAFRAAREGGWRVQAMNNLKQLAIGMHNYHDNYDHFPHAVTYNPQGEAVYGWRYAIAVFLTQIGLPVDEDGTINRHWWHFYNHALPWNDPANLAIVKGTQELLYVRGGTKNRVDDCTNFVVVTGPETLFPEGQARRMGDISDGARQTIMFVEIDESDIPWYEPRDLRFDQMSFRINDPDRSKPCIGNRRSKGALVAMADGSVRFLPEDTPPETLRAMLTIAGGEEVTVEP